MTDKADAEFTRQLSAKTDDLRRYARRLTGNTVDAEDLVQDCLVRALTNWHRFEEGTNLRAWLFTVMRNLHINSFRRPSHHEVPLPPDELALVAPSRPAGQEAAIEFTDFLRAFDRLSPARQETIVMVGWDGMSYDDAAVRLDVPTGTVRSRLSRARQELREALRGTQ
jgi:RNA polymerase sigma-70 factor, ECF subfamily